MFSSLRHTLRSRPRMGPYPAAALRRLHAVAAFAVFAAVPLAPMSGQSLGYTFTPAASGISWEDGLGLRNKALYGGALSIDFERWLSLQGYFFTNNGVAAAVDRLDVPDDVSSGLGDQRLRVRSYGANLKVPLVIGDVAPYLTAGGGILDFRPDNGERTRQVALNLGGGFRIALAEALHLDLFAHDAMFRVDRLSLFQPSGAAALPDPGADELRHNLVFGGGLGIPFGASRTGFSGPAQRPLWGLLGASFSLEPTAGQIRFESDMLPNQDLAGLRAGVDLGQLVGLRGFYWRGVRDNFTNTAPVQSWGGEAQLRLNAGPGIAPFILLGGAQLDFTSDYRNVAGERVSDETALILGGGVTVPLTERLAVNIAARDYLVSENTALETVSHPSELTHNMMYSVGLRFSVGGREGSDAARARAARQDRLARELARERAQRDSLETVLARRAASDSMARRIAAERDARDSLERGDLEERRTAAQVDTVRLTEAAERQRDTQRTSPPGSYVSGRDVTIPAPATGEIYVRYGPERDRSARPADVPAMRGEMARPPRTPTAERAALDEELRDFVRQAIRDELGDRPARALDEARRVDPRAEAAHTDMPGDDRRAPAAERREPARAVPEARIRTSGGEVDRVPVRKEPVRDTGDVPGREPLAMTPTRPSDANLVADIRTEVRALLDSIRLEVRAEREPLSPRAQAAAALLEQRIVDRVDSVIRAQRTEERTYQERLYEDRVRTDREARMPRPAAPADMVPVQRSLPLVTYTGANLTDGTQALLGTRLDLGPVGGYSSLRFVPELALGWGEGARSVMAVGNVQLRLPTMRLGQFPTFTPQLGLGAGLLHFNEEVSGRDGLDGVLNLGYGAAIDLWQSSSNRNVPVLVVEHQGVDLFSLNRLIAGLRWRF